MALGWIWWRAWSPLVARGAAALCVGGVAFAQHQPSVCVAGVTLLALAWIRWRTWSPLVAPLMILLPPGQPADQQISRPADQRSWRDSRRRKQSLLPCHFESRRLSFIWSHDRMIHTATQSRLTNYGKTPPVRVKHVISCSYKDLVFLAQEESRPRPIQRS